MSDTSQDVWVEVRRFETFEDADQHALALVAAGIGCSIAPSKGSVAILVAASVAVRALAELAAYDRDNRPVPPPPATARPLLGGYGGVAAYACALLAVHGAATRDLFSRDWVSAGDAQTALILGGEWWRALTALGLHADLGHLASNLVAGALFGLLVGQIVGGGVGWLAILAAGGAGNALNALLQPPAHTAIGASTAVFGAVGLLAVLMLRYQRTLWRSGPRRWLPLAVGVMVLAFLGVEGDRIDVGAHVAGFVSGGVIGAALATVGPRLADRTSIQAACWAVAAVLFGSAWAIALTAGGS